MRGKPSMRWWQRAGLLCLLFSAACHDEPVPTPAPDAVLHFAEHTEEVLSLEGAVRQLNFEPLLVLEELPCREVDANHRLASLPWPAQPGTLNVGERGGRSLEEVPLARLPLVERGFAHVPTRRRVPAHSLASDTAPLVEGRRTPEHVPAHVRLGGDVRRLAHSLPLVLPGGTLRVLARAGGAQAGTITVTCGGTPIGTRDVPAGAWSPCEFSLDAPAGLHLVEIHGAESAVDITWLEVLHDGPEQLLVRGANATPLRVTYAPVPPRAQDAVHPGPGPAQGFPVLTVGGEVTIVPRGAPESAARTFDLAPGLHHLPIEAADRWFDVRQPLARLLPQALDPERELHPASDLASARCEIDGDRRAGFWLPSSSRLEHSAELRAGDRIRFAVGLPHDPPPTLEEARRGTPPPPPPPKSAVVVFTVTWVPSHGPTKVLDSVRVPTVQHGWQEREVVVPVAAAGRGVLRWETRGPVSLPAAFGEPRRVRTSSPGDRPPNVLVYLIDTLRADHLSCYGARNATSPRIDALAADGFRFTSFHAVAPWTRPATATLLTGFYPEWHGMGRELPMPRSLDTLAETMAAAGYSTWAAVANPQVGGRGLRFAQGFHRFVTVDGHDSKHASSALLNDAVRPWIAANADEPFLLYVHSLDPHSPYEPPPDAASPFGRNYDGPLRDEPLTIARLRALSEVMDEADRRHVEDIYDNEVHHQDEQLGALLDELEAHALLDNTVVVVLSDHGEEFLDHGDWNHGYRMWQEQLAVPFVLWIPPRRREAWGLAPRPIDAPVSQVDFLPGLVDLLGVPDPFPRQGRSWRPLLAGDPAGLRSPYGVDYQAWEGDEIGSFLHGRHKLIWNLDQERGTVTERLYDLEADPGEHVDLAADQPALLDSLRILRDALRADSAGIRDRLDALGLPHVRPADPATTAAARIDAHAARAIEALGYAGGD